MLLAALLAVGACPRASAGEMDRFSQVVIHPSAATYFLATVSMEFQPFARHKAVYSSTYAAHVFPFFYRERGRIWITIPDDDLAKVAQGQAVDFKGKALNDSGDERKVEGRATPTGPQAGRIRVRVIVSRRIVLTYDTTYELTGTPAAEPPTPRPAR